MTPERIAELRQIMEGGEAPPLLRHEIRVLLDAYEDAQRLEPSLPKGESEARNEICDALTELIRGVAEIAWGSGESYILDIRNERHEGEDDGSLTVRGLLRFMTTYDPEGRDGDYGELVQRTWTRVGRALIRTHQPRHHARTA